MLRTFFKSCTSLVAAIAVAQPILVTSVKADDQSAERWSFQPDPGPEVVPYFSSEKGGKPGRQKMIELLQSRVKYVFVIFNENHSFDNEFGTFPGANGIYSDGDNPRSAQDTPGFTQKYIDLVTGAKVKVRPFLLGPKENANVVDSVDHSHTGLATKLNVVNNSAALNQFAFEEYSRFASKGGAANEAQGTQFSRLVMSHIDCDTIPFYWQYATRFTLFDNIFATEDTPSSPNAIAMIAGQSGETQWVKHGPNGASYVVGNHSGTTQGPPIVNDPQPFYGSQFDTTTQNKQPAGANESYADNNIASNLTFATLPLTMAGRKVKSVMKQDLNPAFDEPDIQQDIPFIKKADGTPVNWRWYQEGYDLEPTDAGGVASHKSFVSHHQGPQYFGYLANNPALRSNFRGMNDFFTDMQNDALPKDGGVFYVRGGYTNVVNQLPHVNPRVPSAEAAAIIAAKAGDDDHPSYSDRQISEAMAARVINAVARNPDIWRQSAIIITYDESDGFYDHVPPRIQSYGPDGLPLSRGLRVPLTLISPFAKVHAVSHVEGDHNAVIQTINEIFGLPPLASLPDEAQALIAGEGEAFNGPNGFVQHHLGPRDINSDVSGDLLSGFDWRRLEGLTPELPASYARIPASVVNTFPHYEGRGCERLGIVTEDRRQGIQNDIPAGFNPLPSTYPAAN